jgi:hypothetical protein
MIIVVLRNMTAVPPHMICADAMFVVSSYGALCVADKSVHRLLMNKITDKVLEIS